MHSYRPRHQRRPSAVRSPEARGGAQGASSQAQGHRLPPLVVAPPRPILPPTAELLAQIAASPFVALGVTPPIVRAVVEEGYTEPTPIQTAVIASVLDGRDVLACAQTGTGKTAAFVLPLLQQLAAPRAVPRERRAIRVLVLTPTRELAAQIGERIGAYGRYLGLTHAVVYGGVSQRPQELALRSEPDFLVATPGRLIDLMQQGHVRLDGIEHFILDEADRMLDMGFVHDVRRIVARIPARRQTLLFSATMPAEIEVLTRQILVNPVSVAVRPAATTADTVDQTVMFVDRDGKRALLESLLRAEDVLRALVFTRTKHGANRLREQLDKAGIESAVIHGNKSQGARERALGSFRAGTTRVLVATDVAARGIDVDGISHVFNFDMPEVAENYVHRIGRTGRAGAAGKAISLCGRDERDLLAQIERVIRRRLPVVDGPRGLVVDARPDVDPRGPPPPRRPQQGGRARSYGGRSDNRSYGSSRR